MNESVCSRRSVLINGWGEGGGRVGRIDYRREGREVDRQTERERERERERGRGETDSEGEREIQRDR